MGFLQFGKEEKKPKVKRPPQPFNLERLMERTIARELRSNPQWALQIAKQKLGYQESDEDPVEKAERKALAEALETDPEFREAIKAEHLASMRATAEKGDIVGQKIDEAVINEIESNPEVLRGAVKHRIQSLLEGSNGSSSDDPVSSMLKTLRSMRELEDEMGVKKGSGFGQFITPELLTEVIKILPVMVGKAAMMPAPMQVYVIDTPEGPKELSAEQYQQWKQQKALQAPKQEKAVEEQGKLRLADWNEYIGKDPHLFIDRLQNDASKGDKDAKVTIELLELKTASEIIEMLKPYRDNPEVGDTIKLLEQNVEWLDAVVELLKEPKVQNTLPEEKSDDDEE